jgi:hypothetical protein
LIVEIWFVILYAPCEPDFFLRSSAGIAEKELVHHADSHRSIAPEER